MLDKDRDNKLREFITNKSKLWDYENEYRMLIYPYPDEILLSRESFDNGLMKFQKEDLEGVIFGLKISRKNAKLVYDTIKFTFRPPC